ncbi:hypothetical protein AX17_000073 [Amanita inopinata Kibby_2008]|nr:hypothetical protein AX17_000073 [Amanita inopinata Kibby_2008]
MSVTSGSRGIGCHSSCFSFISRCSYSALSLTNARFLLANAFKTTYLCIMYHYSGITPSSESNASTYGLTLQYPEVAGPPNTNAVVSRYPPSCGCAEKRDVSIFPSQKYVAVSVTNVYIGVIRIKDNIERVPMVARVSVTDYRGDVILDTYVRPTHRVEDYRTAETGIQHSDLANAPFFHDVQRRVANIIQGKVIIGHRLWDFLSVLGLIHPAIDTRDLALFRPLRKKLKSRTIIGLPTLVHLFMGRNVGLDYENSVELARASLDLFRSVEDLFEGIIKAGAWPCDLPPSSYADYYT